MTRAIAIATEVPYATVYKVMAAGSGSERISAKSRGILDLRTALRGGKKPRTARNGIHVKRKWFKDYMTELGWKWTPTMGIGTGCKVHLVHGELPWDKGSLIVAVNKHYTTVVGGCIMDTFDPSRGGTRCVYGYWSKA